MRARMILACCLSAFGLVQIGCKQAPVHFSSVVTPETRSEIPLLDGRWICDDPGFSDDVALLLEFAPSEDDLIPKQDRARTLRVMIAPRPASINDEDSVRYKSLNESAERPQLIARAARVAARDYLQVEVNFVDPGFEDRYAKMTGGLPLLAPVRMTVLVRMEAGEMLIYPPVPGLGEDPRIDDDKPNPWTRLGGVQPVGEHGVVVTASVGALIAFLSERGTAGDAFTSAPMRFRRPSGGEGAIFR